MKTRKLIILWVVFTGFILSVNAQSSQYLSAMKDNVGKLNPWKDSPQNIAAAFERIAQAEKTQWLPYYYASYVGILNCFSLGKPEDKDKMVDHVQELIDKAFSLNPDSSEMMALQGFLYLAALQVDPVGRGAEYSAKANQAFDASIALNPANPRGYYLKATTILNTPEFWGGGKENAIPLFKKAISAYNEFKPISEISPVWGKDDCTKQYAAIENADK